MEQSISRNYLLDILKQSGLTIPEVSEKVNIASSSLYRLQDKKIQELSERNCRKLIAFYFGCQR